MRTKKGGIVLVTVFAVFCLSSIAWAVDCPLPDTGQTKCYDKDSEITCPNPGQDFYGQDAQYICNPQSYTSLAGGIMVQDNVTGLIWEVKQDKDDTSNYTNPHDADNTYTWYDGSSGTPGDGTDTLDFIAALNSSQFGGYSDWRLPTIMELAFLVDRNSYNNPSINTTYFPNTQSSSYWSSTTITANPYAAWLVDFGGGEVHYGDKSSKYNYSYVRAVRAGQSGPLCPIESLYGEHSEQTELLRYFRDNVLYTTPEGQEVIKLYYELSPVVVEMMEEDELFKQEVKQVIDGVVESVR